MPNKILTMKLLKDKFAICRLNNNESVPQWAKESNFFSITKTPDELSIVCSQDSVPSEILCEKDWIALKVEGPLDFSLIGILSSITTILADKKISVFAISTYDTDYILVKDKEVDKALDALSAERYEIIKE